MTKRLKLTVAGLALLALGAGDAEATYSAYWAIDWDSNVRNISYRLLNQSSSIRMVGIAAGTGREAQSASGVTTVGEFTQYSPVFCVDLLHNAADNWASPFNVDVHTGADGIAGWVTPSGDGDEFRSPAGLGRAAALASRFGTAWTTDGSLDLATSDADRSDRAVALNVAIWQAAYGSNFEYLGGLTANQLFYYNTYYLPYYNTGASTMGYTWWDSRAFDAPSTAQDFVIGEVPEPTALLLLGSVLAGGAGLQALRRRRQSSSK
jgi:hypothetical protein